MKQFNFPTKETWNTLIERPKEEEQELTSVVSSVISAVKSNGDKALVRFSKDFDNVVLDRLKVSETEIQNATCSIELQNAILVAKENIERFHKKQLIVEPVIETIKGVNCWRKSVPIERVGLYIPGGTAPLFSTILMLGIPAKIAGCKEVIVCTPPQKDGSVNPVILWVCKMLKINKIFKVGGAQAVAAMAYGTETIPQVYKIFGPGNQYVTKAKELVQQTGTAIDMPAGPSEVLVIADENSNPVFVAADLLSQAEHGADSQVVLCSDSAECIKNVRKEIEQQIISLPRKSIAQKALQNSFSVVFKSLEECMEFSNTYAPEHLIVNTIKNNELVELVVNAGSVFIGQFSCESLGDYATGTNHTLPTNGFSKSYSGVSVDSFLKKITFQRVESNGILALGKSVEIMAEAENLIAHKNAVSVRLKELSDV